MTGEPDRETPEAVADVGPGPDRRTRYKEYVVTRHATEGWAVLDELGRITEISTYAAIPTWGPRLVGAALADLVDPDQRSETEDVLDRVRAAPHEPVVTELHFSQRDPRTLWYEVVFVNLLDDPDVRGIVANVRDVTARRRADEAARFRARLLDTVGQAVVAVDPDLRITYWNRAAEAAYGWSAAEAVGSDIRHVSPWDSGPYAADIADALGSGLGWTGEVWVRHRGGSSLPILLTVTPLVDVSGRPSGTVGIAVDISDRKAFEQELERLARQDSLTGLPNRAFLAEHLEGALREMCPERPCLAVVFADVDRFKLVNDSMGHGSGDELLVAIARRVREVLPQATVARFGGDEFVAVVEDAGDGAAGLQAARQLIGVADEPFAVGGTEIYATISAGVVLATPGSTAESVLRDADVAMYKAKKAGGGRVCVFDERDLDAVKRHVVIERELRGALANGELDVFYQPVLELESERVVGAEALVRWRHPVHGLLEPGAFLPVAEATGIIGQLTRVVLSAACQQVTAWAADSRLTDGFTIAVNLSAPDLADPALVGYVADLLAETGLAPRQLVLEVTETALIHDTEVALSSLRRLRLLGVLVALDDFGTGYSSLSFLRRFPVDVLKIDRSFVADVGRDAGDTALIGGIVSLGRALGLDVVAEGVEEPRQASELRRLGCHLAQGFLWSPAVPEDAFFDATAGARFAAGTGRLVGDGPDALRP